MERKNFITSALIKKAAMASAKTLMPNTAKKLPKKPFFVKAGDDRFNDHVMFHGEESLCQLFFIINLLKNLNKHIYICIM